MFPLVLPAALTASQPMVWPECPKVISIQCESDKILREALKQRVFPRGDKFSQGDWIYYKNKSRRWEGPIKLIATDGKLLYGTRTGRLLTINSDHAILSAANNDISSRVKKISGENKEAETADQNEIVPHHLQSLSPVVELSSNLDVAKDNDIIRCVDDKHDKTVEEIKHVDDSLCNHDSSNEADDDDRISQDPIDINCENSNVRHENHTVKPQYIRKDDIVTLTANGDSSRVRVISRAGKIGKSGTGKYKHFWNVQNLENDSIQCVDLEAFELQNCSQEDENLVDVFAVNIPRVCHGEKRCRDAKEEELSRFDEFNAYQEVQWSGEPLLGTNWVLTEKIKDGKTSNFSLKKVSGK